MAGDTVRSISFEAGYFVVTDEHGRSTRYAIADMLRAADIPSLTYTQVAAIKALANLTGILIRTLIEREVLDESFADSLGMDWDLDYIIEAIEQMGGAYYDPNLDDA